MRERGMKMEHRRIDDRDLKQFLSPLREVVPVPVPSPSTRVPRSGRARGQIRRVLLLAALIATLGAAAFGATRVFGPLHGTELTPPPSGLTCSGIIGESAAKADAYLEVHHFRVSWRLERFGSKVVPSTEPDEPTGVEGGRAIHVAEPPPGTVLFDIARVGPGASRRVIATVIEKDDPNAPTLTPATPCAGS
jgi:hypothetical protein